MTCRPALLVSTIPSTTGVTVWETAEGLVKAPVSQFPESCLISPGFLPEWLIIE